jgi:lipoate-protein ligase A
MPIFEQLQLEEALLRADDRNWCLVNEGASPAIVMGISGKHEEHVNRSAMEQQPVPLIRRFSGGGTVVVDEKTIFFTLIGNKKVLDFPCYPSELLHWTEELYAPAFDGIDFALRDNDYVIGKHKFGGNAQYLCKDRWLHHTSLLWDFQPLLMDYLLMPSRTPAYRQGRSHTDFLCCLKDYFRDHQLFLERMIGALELQFEIVQTSLQEALQIQQRPHRKGTELIKLDFRL